MKTTRNHTYADRSTGARKFVVVSSSELYGTHVSEPMTEVLAYEEKRIRETVELQAWHEVMDLETATNCRLAN